MIEDKMRDLRGGRAELSRAELNAATEVTQAFLSALKNYGLFPAEHASTTNMMRGLCANLNSFVNRYGDLRLVIERGRIRVENEVIFEEYHPENNPAFVFFRDGILWLDFEKGLEPYEILQFFRIVNRFKAVQDEPEGDLVTELWSAELPHINYGVSENLWEAEPVLEFSLLNPEPPSFPEQGEAEDLLGFAMLRRGLDSLPESSDSARSEDRSGGSGIDGGETAETFGNRHDQEGRPLAAGRGRETAEFDTAEDGASDLILDGQPSREAAGSDAVEIEVGPTPGAPEAAGESGDRITGSSLPSGISDYVPGTISENISAGSESGTTGRDEPSSRQPEVVVPDPEELDFWAALQKINPPVKSASPGAAVNKKPAGKVERPVIPETEAAEEASPVTVPARSEVRPGNNGSRPGSGLANSGEGQGGGTGAGFTGMASSPGKSRQNPVIRRQAFEIPKGRDAFPMTDTATSKTADVSRAGREGDREDGDDSGGDEFISLSIASDQPEHSLWRFSEIEKRTLQEMVRAHEEGDNSADLIEILMILLKMEDEPQVVIAILGFLMEEFRISLANRNLKVGRDLLEGMVLLRAQPGLLKDWAPPLLDKFMTDVAEPGILSALTPLWAELPTLDSGTLEDFAALLQLLPPRSAEALADMATQIESGSGRRILLDLIANYAAKELDTLERILNRPEEDLIMRMIRVLRTVPDRERAEQLLFKAVKHPKEKVRQQVCDILLDRESEQFDELFLLIHDPSPLVRARIFAYLGRQRNRRVEQLLKAHMASARFLKQNFEHISRCYLALGACGSDESLPLLNKILFSQPWNFMVGLGQPVHRQGAAIALYKIHTPASLKLLGGAKFNSVPHIRKAWNKATGN